MPSSYFDFVWYGLVFLYFWHYVRIILFPTPHAASLENETYYSFLSHLHCLVFGWDWSSILKTSYFVVAYGQFNKNGERLATLALENNLKIINTFF